MASWAKPEVRTPTDTKGPTLVPPIEFETRAIEGAEPSLNIGLH